MTKIVATPEFYGAMTENLDDSAMEEFAANPVAYLKDTLGVEAGIYIRAVRNAIDTMNLTLPYYEGLEKTGGTMLSDDDLEAASGGAGDLVGNNIAVTAASAIISDRMAQAANVVFALADAEKVTPQNASSEAHK